MVDQKNYKFVCISDLHNIEFVHKIPDGDVLIISGDLTKRGFKDQFEQFFNFLDAQPHPHKIVIGGNHDMSLDEENFETMHKANWFSGKDIDIAALKQELKGKCHYLENEYIDILGFRIYGSPNTLKKEHKESKIAGFAVERSKIDQLWQKIPADIDILITHSPPFGILDMECKTNQNCGCEHLRKQVFERIKPRVHVFGHIHEGHGQCKVDNTLFINAASVFEKVQSFEPIVFYLQNK